MKKRICFLLSVILLACGALVPQESFAASPSPTIEAEAAILVDMTTGDILFEKNSREQLYPASTTKMITCLLALENLKPDKIVIADEEVAATGGTVVPLKVDEAISVEALENVMMVVSANDAAVALAKAVSGSVPEFAKLMNERAKELGAEDTNFVTPNGLHDDAHVSTAYDLAMIALGCMKNETFRKIVKQPAYTVPETNKSLARAFNNTNLLLYSDDESDMVYVGGVRRVCKYDGIIGVKTGYTGRAGGCLVSAAERNGTKILCVVLKSSTMGRFADSISLLDWGFANYKTLKVLGEGATLGAIKVKGGAVRAVEAVMSSDALATIPADASDAVLSTEIKLFDSLKAPVEAGTRIGEVLMYEGGALVASYSAIAAQTVEKGGILSNIGIPDKTAAIIWTILKLVFLVIFLLLVVYVLIKRRQTRIKKARKAARLEKKRREEEARRREWESSYRNRYIDYEDEDER